MAVTTRIDRLLERRGGVRDGEALVSWEVDILRMIGDRSRFLEVDTILYVRQPARIRSLGPSQFYEFANIGLCAFRTCRSGYTEGSSDEAISSLLSDLSRILRAELYPRLS